MFQAVEAFKDKKKYCKYFQYLSAFSLIAAILLFISLVYKKKLDMTSLPAFVSFMLVYFQNRLLYTMCTD